LRGGPRLRLDATLPLISGVRINPGQVREFLPDFHHLGILSKVSHDADR
jgi:hypothetical protein